MKKVLLLATIVFSFMGCGDDDEPCNCEYYPELGRYLKMPFTPRDVEDATRDFPISRLEEMDAQCREFCE